MAAGAKLQDLGYNGGMQISPPFNLQRMDRSNRDLLKPPVGNKLLFEDDEFIVMAVGGPNSRKDFHHDPGAEFFFQLEGDMVLRTIQAGRVMDVPIREGEVFLLPPEVPHSPQRPAGSVGIVVERRRRRRRIGWLFLVLRELRQSPVSGTHRRRATSRRSCPRFSRDFIRTSEQRTCASCGTVLQAPPREPVVERI